MKTQSSQSYKHFPNVKLFHKRNDEFEKNDIVTEIKREVLCALLPAPCHHAC
jgi:hypothetical protein